MPLKYVPTPIGYIPTTNASTTSMPGGKENFKQSSIPNVPKVHVP